MSLFNCSNINFYLFCLYPRNEKSLRIPYQAREMYTAILSEKLPVKRRPASGIGLVAKTSSVFLISEPLNYNNERNLNK